jgi:hypothetical protein
MPRFQSRKEGQLPLSISGHYRMFQKVVFRSRYLVEIDQILYDYILSEGL